MRKKLLTITHYVISFGVIVLVLTIVFDQLLLPWYVKRGERIRLPDVRSMQFKEAEELLNSMGFTPVKGDLKYNAEFDPGTVIDQQPTAGSTVKTGRRVYLTVAIEEKFIEMPTLVGKTVRGAKLELSRVGLSVDTMLLEYSDTFPEDVITWQSVEPKGLIRRGSSVTMRVSSGTNPNEFVVPEVVDYSLKEGRKKIENAGLEVGEIKYVQDTDLVTYTILEQSLEPGMMLEESAKIDLVVSVLDLNDIFNEQMRQK